MTSLRADVDSATAALSACPDDELLRVMADPLRARIVALLAVEQLCTCHLAELTGAKQTNLSNHLRVLREAGLVAAEPAGRGRFTYYRLVPARLAALGEQLTALADQASATTGRKRPCT